MNCILCNTQADWLREFNISPGDVDAHLNIDGFGTFLEGTLEPPPPPPGGGDGGGGDDADDDGDDEDDDSDGDTVSCSTHACN